MTPKNRLSNLRPATSLYQFLLRLITVVSVCTGVMVLGVNAQTTSARNEGGVVAATLLPALITKLVIVIALVFAFCGVINPQATRPRSTRIITASAWPYGTPEVGDEWIDTSVSPAETRNCLVAGVWSTVAVLSPDGTSSNSINGSGQTVQIALSGFRGVGVAISGTWSGTLVPELSLDGGTTWVAAQFYDSAAKAFSSSSTGNITASIIVTGGASHARIRSSSWSSGTATIALRSTEASTPVVDAASLPLPSGAATSANQTNGTQQSKVTQAVPTSLTTLQNAATANGNGTPMDVSGYSSVSFIVTGTFDATVFFEGTIDGSNWVILTAVAWDNGGFWNNSFTQSGSYVTSVGSLSQVRARIADYESGTITVKAVASLAFSTIANKGVEVIPTTPFKIVGSSGNAIDSSVSASAAPINQVVTGGVYNSTKPTLADGNAVAVQLDAKGNQLSVVRDAAGNDRGANVNASNQLSVSVDNTPSMDITDKAARDLGKVDIVSLDQYTPVSGRLPVDGSGVTQPVSASSLPLPTGAATSTKQSDGSQKTQIVDGSGNVIGSTSNALDINIKSGNPTTITATQGTASNLHTAATLDAETTKVIGTVRLLGNGGATVDAAIGAAAAPTNQIVTGGVFNSTKPTLTNGQSAAIQLDSKGNYLGVIRDAAGNDRGANVNGSSQLSVSVDNSPVLGAGSAVIGHVIADSGSTTAVTQATASNLNADANVKTVGGNTVLTGNGVTGTGSQRVTIASDNTAISVNNTQQGTASQNVAQVGGSTVSTAATGVQKVGIVGAAGTTLDAATAGVLDVNVKNWNNTATLATASVGSNAVAFSAKRSGTTLLAPNYSASHITTKTTTTITSATAYISAIAINVSGAGTSQTLTIQNKEATAKILYSVTIAVGNTYIQFPEPILMTSGIDIVTGGTTAGTQDVFITWWQ